jgi:hypothetical protein
LSLKTKVDGFSSV